MNSQDIILIGVKSRVMALSKTDGHIHWSTALPAGMGNFVTVLADGQRIYAHTHGQLHCLDLATGRVLWTNELAGCGYGFASLALPDGAAAPDSALAAARLAAEQQQAGAAAAA